MIYFVTRNTEKARHANYFFEKYGIKIEHKEMEYEEVGETVHETAKRAAKMLAEKFNNPVFVDDTGFFFDAYDNFPGVHPRFVYEGIGFDGIFRLLEGKDRGSYFLCCVGYCEPGQEAVVFEGKMHGEVLDRVVQPIENPKQDHLPYARIFVPEGQSKVLVEKDYEEKTSLKNHHRSTAFRKLAEYLKSKEG